MHSSISETKIEDVLYLEPPKSTQVYILPFITKQHETVDDNYFVGCNAMGTQRYIHNVSEKDTVYSLGAVSLKCWYLPISPFGNTTQNNHHLQCHKNLKSHQSGALKTQMKISDQWLD